ncbi:MAG TPA: redoxin domain-containing protein, partial [Candidatus Poseidoniales archaeon]|nr:redoxin domain-containing protein [Candidatus Poseidoniales archaeon]
MVPRFFQRNRVLLTVGVAVLLIAGTLVMMLTGGSEEAPEFSATSTGYIDGEESNRTLIKLSDYRGQVVILDLMAEWCGPCKVVASGTLKPLYKEEYRDSDKVVIISVSIANDSLDLLEDMQREYGYDWLHVTNNDLDVITKYNAQQIPKVVVIDQQGQITFSALGIVEQDKLQQEVESA